jgi:hypothetical protein
MSFDARQEVSKRAHFAITGRTLFQALVAESVALPPEIGEQHDDLPARHAVFKRHCQAAVCQVRHANVA